MSAGEDIPFAVRLRVADIADALHDIDCERTARKLLEAVRCCEFFPECAHVLSALDDRPFGAAGAPPE